MKTKFLIVVVGLVLTGVFVGIYAIDMINNFEAQKSQETWMENRAEILSSLSKEKKCEQMGGIWNSQHCLMTPETFDRNKLTCDPGPVLENGICSSNGVTLVIQSESKLLEEIEGYAIDYDGDVKHLPFADICTDEMKVILLTHSNIALPEEEFVIEDIGLPFGMNQEDFERCAHETSFTKSRWNMITRENFEPVPMKCKSGPAPSGEYYFDEDTCKWEKIENEN